MPEPLNLRIVMGDIEQIASQSPRLFDLLFKTLSVRPDGDDQAAGGAVQVIQAYTNLGLSPIYANLFVDLCDNDPLVAYTILRSVEFGFCTDHELCKHMEKKNFPYRRCLKYLRTFLPKFGGRVISIKMGALNDVPVSERV